MKILKAFNKVLGGILFAFFVIFTVCFYLGGLALSIYIMLMSWVSMPLGTPTLDLPLETKVFISSLGVILFLSLLACVYFSIETTINPSPIMRPRPWLRPKPPKDENKSKKPILG